MLHGAAALHGDMNQRERKRVIERMKRGEHRLLVATDVAARGLDITGLSHVINFDLPRVAEDYIHRIGRTGRGGASGIAISLVGPDDHGNLRGIERLVGRRLERTVIAGLEPKRGEPRPERSGRPSRGYKPQGRPGFKGHGQSNWSGAPRADRGGSRSEAGAMLLRVWARPSSNR